MENKQTWVRFFALIGFALIIINGIFAFGVMGNTAFAQILLIVLMVALTVVAMQFTKDVQESLPVLGATLLYFVGLLVRGFFFLLDSFVGFCQDLSLENVRDKINYPGDLPTEKLTALRERRDNLLETIDKDTFGEIMDVLSIIFAVAFAAFAVLCIIQILRKKDFAKTLMGKFTCLVMGKSIEKEQSIEQEKTEN